MPKFFVKEEQIQEKHIEIIGKDVNHIRNVLRKKEGDILIICNSSNEINYQCEINKINEEKIICNILEELSINTESNVKITVFQGLPKADKMELIIQKSVELGVFEIIPVEMARCVVKLKENDKRKKEDRWQKIAEVAAKQCERNYIPKIKPIISLKNICQKALNYDIVLVAYEKEEKQTLKEAISKIKEKQNENSNSNIKIAIVIGPEGGLEKSEIKLLEENDTKIITLGKRILRTETVALQMISILMYELEK